MALRYPNYSKEEFAQRGDEIYESQVRLPPVGFSSLLFSSLRDATRTRGYANETLCLRQASPTRTPTQIDEESDRGKIVAITSGRLRQRS
jgi:hypothetical protein